MQGIGTPESLHSSPHVKYGLAVKGFLYNLALFFTEAYSSGKKQPPPS